MPTGTTNANLRLRSGPSLDNAILQIIPKGTQLTILDTSNDWLHVQTTTSTMGYVSSQYVDIQPSTPPVAPPTTPPVAPPASISKLLVPSGPTLNVRSSPAIMNNPDNKIDALQADAVLTPLEPDAVVATKVGTTQAQGLWIHVRTPSGKEGYVAAWLVAYQGTVVTPPVNPITDLNSYIDSIPAANDPLPEGYYAFWAQRQKLGLPDPFDGSSTQLGYPALARLPVNGFGPNTFAMQNWHAFYSGVGGMHNGLDHIVPLGTPLLAVSDGVIVGTQQDWKFLSNPNDKSIILWCFMPNSVRDAQGRRMMSNVLVAYGHMSDNTVVKRHDVVSAGQVIGISGRPFGEAGNDHLHLEVHMLSGDNNLPRKFSGRPLVDYQRAQPFNKYSPFNPLLYFSERLVRYHLHQGKKLGFGTSSTYPDATMLSSANLRWPPLDFFSVAEYQYGSAPIWTVNTAPPWPSGIFDLPTVLQRIANYVPFDPYPIDFLSSP